MRSSPGRDWRVTTAETARADTTPQQQAKPSAKPLLRAKRGSRSGKGRQSSRDRLDGRPARWSVGGRRLDLGRLSHLPPTISRLCHRPPGPSQAVRLVSGRRQIGRYRTLQHALGVAQKGTTSSNRRRDHRGEHCSGRVAPAAPPKSPSRPPRPRQLSAGRAQGPQRAASSSFSKPPFSSSKGRASPLTATSATRASVRDLILITCPAPTGWDRGSPVQRILAAVPCHH